MIDLILFAAGVVAGAVAAIALWPRLRARLSALRQAIENRIGRTR